MMDALMKRKANIRAIAYERMAKSMVFHQGNPECCFMATTKILDDGEGLEIKDDGGNLDQGSDIYHRDNHFGKTHIGDVGTLPKEEIKG